jgi:aminoglycoside/choline kinase family phosphotransferase/GTP:adenosylcobinamide-phosphate guanylyltransferase
MPITWDITKDNIFGDFLCTAAALTAIFSAGMMCFMKAMILAAGLGTRLLPLTKKTPKPLFPILGQPLIDILVRRLQDTGCEAVIINTHHLAEKIDQFVKGQDYGIPVHTRYEPTILGTGGAIKNVEDFWDEKPFMVVNSDVFTNIDLAQIHAFHLSQQNPATLVLHDCPPFNHVWIDPEDHVVGFGQREPCPPPPPQPLLGAGTRLRQLAFTGIQVLDPWVLDFIPPGAHYGIIDAYCDMIRSGITPKGCIAQNHYWHDIGTMAGYHGAAREALAREALETLSPGAEPETLAWADLKGDGSDRTWYRVSLGRSSVVLVDHGLPPEGGTCEADSFFLIGRHLHSKGVPVPRLYDYDRPSGMVVLEDVGDVHLQTVVRGTKNPTDVVAHYRAVMDILIKMGIEGARGFDPVYTYQTARYDRELIMEREAKYFVTAFLNGYHGLEIGFEQLKEECELIAKLALETDYIGFMHRDFQSRNILVRGKNYYVIDFQGGRLGPLQYDLASLLIDPYVELPRNIQDGLLSDYLTRLSEFVPVDPGRFLRAYQYCAINRNLQILGAFAFLSHEKGKKDFQVYIPPALKSLKQRLQNAEPRVCRQLRRIVEGL